jgi:hypothetical protein
MTTTTMLIQAMRAIEPQADRGALVSIPKLRAALGNPVDFDRAVLRAADNGVLALHRHDYGWRDPQRGAMIQDPHDHRTYFVGVGIREDRVGVRRDGSTFEWDTRTFELSGWTG